MSVVLLLDEVKFLLQGSDKVVLLLKLSLSIDNLACFLYALNLGFSCLEGQKRRTFDPVGSNMLLPLLSGIFLENIFKYQNDHCEKVGGAILAQCLLYDIFSAGMAP